MVLPKGIHNLGNTCFLNACMQILLQTYELDTIDTITIQQKTETIESYIYKEWKLWRQNINDPSISIISPNSFIHTIHQIAQHKNRILFTGFAQNDMPEFLLFFIENIHIYLKQDIEYTIHGIKQNEIDELAIQCYQMKKKYYENDYSSLIDIFYGISISSILSIHNQHTLSSISEPFFIIDLPICGNTIYDCFDQYISPELLENENAWFNDKTQQKENVFKQITFWNLPKVIVITFKRFSSEGQRLCKKMEFIDFPLTDLDLSKYIRGYNASKYKYDLYGICNHIGNVMGGHYTAFVKTNEKEWFHCNDTIIEKVENPLHIITPMAYSLFYRCNSV
jgi:ubiquitin carboxyl-terminal hydrolase 8